MRTLLALACVAALSGCVIVAAPGAADYHIGSPFNSDVVEGNGIAASETRALPTLSGLEVGSGLQLEVRVGGPASVHIEGDSNLLALVQTEVRGDALYIGSARRLHSTTPLKLIYTVPHLHALRSAGSAHVTVTALKDEPLSVQLGGSGAVRLFGSVSTLNATVAGSGKVEGGALLAGSADIEVSGSGAVVVGQVRGELAQVRISGSGSVQASGAVHRLNVRVSGSGSADLVGLRSEQADLSAHGSGGISSSVSQSLFAVTNGSGPIRVFGQPPQRTISGRNVQML